MNDRVVQQAVGPDEAGMRLDRWFKQLYPGLGFGHLQKLLRTGQIRVDGKRAKSDTRLESGQVVRIPPLGMSSSGVAPVRLPSQPDEDPETTRAFLRSITLYEDDDVLALNKPYGLAVQGGSGLSRHVDGLLEALRDKKGQKPRIVHRLDRDTSGVLLVAKRRSTASALAEAFRSRDARKVYWALVRLVPHPPQGKISSYLVRDAETDGETMRIAKHGEEGAVHAVSYYSVIEKAANRFAWVSLKPVTGRTHQLRVHMESIGHPILGDPKYFRVENWELPSGMQNRLHLLARRLVIPHPSGGVLDITAPLPKHMEQSWALLGFGDGREDDADA
jgi:23S rRNA pseudouridine955/2504/2580 synthase